MSLRLRPRGVPGSEPLPLPPSPFDRSRLINRDDFESATPKYSEDVAGAGTIKRSIDTARFGSFSVKCVTDAVTNRFCQIIYPNVDFIDGNLGAKIYFASNDDNYDVRSLVAVYDGTNSHLAGIKWTESTEKLAYWGSDAAYHDLPGTYPYYSGIHSWAALKIVCDTINKEYVRAVFMSDEIDLGGYGMEISANATKRTFSSYFKIMAAENVAKTCYFDDFRLTENEPS